MPLTSFGIVGYGNFGQFLARSIAAPGRTVLVTDADASKLPAADGTDAEGLVQAAPIEQVAACDVVFLAVPYGALDAALAAIRPHLSPTSVVTDVVSTKANAGAVMADLLDGHEHVVATHPLFGPPSMERIEPGLRIVVTHEQGERSAELIEFLERDLGLIVERVSAEAHDHAMAYMQSLPFFIARALVDLDIHVLQHQDELSIPSFEKLRTIADIERHHTPEMFETSQLSNPFAGTARLQFIEALINIEAGLSDDGKRLLEGWHALVKDVDRSIAPFDFDVEESRSTPPPE